MVSNVLLPLFIQESEFRCSFYGDAVTVMSQIETGTSQTLLKSEEPNRLRVFWLDLWEAAFVAVCAARFTGDS